MLKGKKAVIFDLDGTLIDSLGIWSAVDELLVTSLGRPDLAADPVTLARLREDALVRHALEPNPYVGFCADLAAFCGSPLPGEEVHRERYHISRALLKSDVRLKPGRRSRSAASNSPSPPRPSAPTSTSTRPSTRTSRPSLHSAASSTPFSRART